MGRGVSSGPQRGALFEIPGLAQLWQWKRENHSRELHGLVLISRSGRWPPLLFQDLKLFLRHRRWGDEGLGLGLCIDYPSFLKGGDRLKTRKLHWGLWGAGACYLEVLPLFLFLQQVKVPPPSPTGLVDAGEERFMLRPEQKPLSSWMSPALPPCGSGGRMTHLSFRRSQCANTRSPDWPSAFLQLVFRLGVSVATPPSDWE